jgi:large subunit ribosomal protein L18
LTLVKKKRMSHLRRRKRVRQKVSGTGNRPRLSVFRSLNHIYTQLVNDELGVTLAEASTLSPELKETVANGGNIEAAQRVGALIAQKAKQQEIEVAVFDRGGHLYHGRIKALAEAAREEGLKC